VIDTLPDRQPVEPEVARQPTPGRLAPADAVLVERDLGPSGEPVPGLVDGPWQGLLAVGWCAQANRPGVRVFD